MKIQCLHAREFRWMFLSLNFLQLINVKMNFLYLITHYCKTHISLIIRHPHTENTNFASSNITHIVCLVNQKT